MNSFVLRDNRFVYINESDEQILIDFNKYIENYSRVPFHNINDGPSLPGYIMDLQNWHKGLDSEEKNWYMYYTLLDVLLTAYHVQSSDPKKILVIGCQDGIMCYHLGVLLGRLHPESLMYCISNTIGNNSESAWLDCISMIEKLPQLAFAATDYYDTNLKDDNFDMVIVNGNVQIDNPDEVMKEGYRVLKNGGQMISFSKEQPLFDSSFRQLFDNIDEYCLDMDGKVLVVEKKV